MAFATRFEFDTVFGAGAAEPEPAEEEALPPPPSFSEDELAEAVAEARRRGGEEALAEAADADARRAAQAMEAIAASLAALGPAHERGWEAVRDDALALAAAIVRKAVPKAVQDAAADAVEAVLTAALPRLIDEPRVVIRMADGLLETLRERVEGAARGCGYPGKVILLADEALHGPDCRIEWADGGAELDSERIWREIDAVIDRHLHGVGEHEAAPAAPENPQEESTDG